jgi:hypothetical protein
MPVAFINEGPDAGVIVIEGFDCGPVRVDPPKIGGLKRLKGLQISLGRDASAQLQKWDADNPPVEDPEGDDVPEETIRETARAQATRAIDRLTFAEDLAYHSKYQWWLLVLIGDDTFKARAQPQPSAEFDDWPADLLTDLGDPIPANATTDQILNSLPLIDRVLRHWGKGRYRSGTTG